jgi:hypothetical protein
MATKYRNNVFMSDNPAQHDDRIADLAIGQTIRAMSGDETEAR